MNEWHAPCPEHRLGDVITVGYRVHAVGAHALEAQVGGERLAIHAEGVTRQRAAAQREGIDARHEVGDARGVGWARRNKKNTLSLRFLARDWRWIDFYD